MAGGNGAKRDQSVFAVVFVVFLIPGVLVEAAPSIYLPYQLVPSASRQGPAPPRRAIQASMKLFPEVPPPQNKAGIDTLKEGAPAVETAYRGLQDVEERLHEGLLSKREAEKHIPKDLLSVWHAAAQEGCSKDNTVVLCMGSNVTKIPTDLGHGTTSIAIIGTSLAEIPNDAFQNYTDLLTIVVVKSPLARVEAGAFRGIAKLSSLSLGLNTLNTVTTFENSTFEGVSSLVSVELNSLGLKSVPEFLLKNATNVIYLDLSANQITSVEAMPDSLQKLEKLELNNNNITAVSSALCNRLARLRDLYLQMNKLTEVSLSGCSSVVNLDISNNSIKTLAFTKMDHLQNLKLAGNQLDKIPNLAIVPRLESLDVSGNNIKVIKEGDFLMLGALKTLTASGMGEGFKVEKGALTFKLETVDFSLNPAMNITTETLLSPPYIHNIDLHGCGITKLDGEAIMNKSSLKTLDISSNPLICDCDARWLPISIEDKKPWAMAWGVDTPSPRCGTPWWLPFGMLTIPEMTKEDFACEVAKVDLITHSNITVQWKADFKLAANLTRGYPRGKWTIPDGEYDNSVGNDAYYTQHYVETYAEVSGSSFKGTVSFTMVASNVVGDTKEYTFFVTQLAEPKNSAGKGGAMNELMFVIILVTSLLLRA